jgi:hypothetical protein
MTSGLLSGEPQYDNSIYNSNLNRDIFNYETTRDRRKIYCCRFGCFIFIAGTNILSFYLGNKLNYKLNW